MIWVEYTKHSTAFPYRFIAVKSRLWRRNGILLTMFVARMRNGWMIPTHYVPISYRRMNC